MAAGHCQRWPGHSVWHGGWSPVVSALLIFAAHACTLARYRLARGARAPACASGPTHSGCGAMWSRSLSHLRACQQLSVLPSASHPPTSIEYHHRTVCCGRRGLACVKEATQSGEVPGCGGWLAASTCQCEVACLCADVADCHSDRASCSGPPNHREQPAHRRVLPGSSAFGGAPPCHGTSLHVRWPPGRYGDSL